MSEETYLTMGTWLMLHGNEKKDQWRQANWKEYLKNG